MNPALSGVPFNRGNTVQRLSLRIISTVIYNLIQRLIVTVLICKSFQTEYESHHFRTRLVSSKTCFDERPRSYTKSAMCRVKQATKNRKNPLQKVLHNYKL